MHLTTCLSPAPHVVLPVTPDKYKEVRRESTQLNDALVTGRLLLGTVATVASGSVVIGSGVILALTLLDLVAGHVRPSPRGRRP